MVQCDHVTVKNVKSKNLYSFKKYFLLNLIKCLKAQINGGAHWVSLVLAAVELVAVVEDVLVCRVKAGFHTVFYHLTGTRRTLKLLDLRIKISPHSLCSVSIIRVNFLCLCVSFFL